MGEGAEAPTEGEPPQQRRKGYYGKEIPVYLFVGLLESGKTKFIQETFEDPNFDSGDKTLLLVCEEGEEEYNAKKFAFAGVHVAQIEDKSELTPRT